MAEKKSNRGILILICLGIWAIVLQNAGIIPRANGSHDGTQSVYVTGGSIDADVNGRVRVENTVDVNLKKINDKSNVFYDFGGNGNYIRIPVMTGN